MKKHTARTLRVALALLVGLAFVVQVPRAGEPIRVGSPTFGTDGAFFTFPAMPISYTTDGGSLGTLPTPVATMVDSMFALWQAVPTSSIAFTNAGTIAAGPAGLCATGGDVDTLADFNCLAGVGFQGNPIIFDVDGSLVDALNGPGASNSILGFAGPLFTSAGGGTIQNARAVLNGKFVDGINNAGNPETSVANMQATALHEYGHFFGLGHSQVNDNCLTNVGVGTCGPFPTGSEDSFGLPTMYPISFGLEEAPGIPSELTLSTDDIAWVSRLYPDPTFATTFGTVSGTVFFSDGATHLQGVNVIARTQDNPGTPGVREDRRFAVSAVSGYRFTENVGQAITGDNTAGSNAGSRNPALRGTYDIPVPAGLTYNVEIEAVNPNFTSGSSVGPFSAEQFPLPGTNPGPINNVGPIIANATDGNRNFTLVGTAATRDVFDAAATNDTIATRTSLGNGTTSASISPFGNISANAPDIDVYAFAAQAGITVNFETFARRAPINGLADTVIEIVNAAGVRQNLCRATAGAGPFTAPCLNDDVNLGVILDSILEFQSAGGGTFFLRVFDWRGEARPDLRYNLVVSGAGQAPPPAGCDSDFDGGGGSADWFDGTNWNPNGLPTGATCIGSTFTVNYVSLGTITVASLNVAGTLNLGGNLDVTNTIAVSGTLNSASGTLNAPISNISNLTMTGGTVNFNGPSASILGLTFTNGALNAVSGTVTLPAAGYNHVGGALRLVGGSVTTAGTINMSGGFIEGAGTLTFLNLNQTGGSVRPGGNLASGVLNLTGNFTQAIGGAFELEIGGLTAGTQYDRLTLNGTGTLDGAINVTLINGFTPVLGNTFTLATASAPVGGNNTSSYPVLGGGLAFSDANSTPTSLVLDVVVATKEFDGGGDGTSWTDPLNWTGNTVPIPTDDVVIGSATNPGPFTVTKNANGAGDSINTLTVANGQGVLTLGANLTIAAASTIGTGGFTQNPGSTFNGGGTLTIAGPFTWAGGTQQGAGTTIANGGITINGNLVAIDARQVINNGIANLPNTFANQLVFQNSGTFVNSASGVFNADHDNGIASVDLTGTFTNAGTFNRGVSGTSFLFDVDFNNNGIANFNSGTVRLVSGGTSSGSFIVSAPATLDFAGGTHTLNAASSVTGNGTVRISAFIGSTVNIAGNGYNVTGTTNVTANTVNFNGTAATNVLTQTGGTVGGSGTLNVSGAFTWTGGTHAGAGTTNGNGTTTIGGGVALNGRTFNNNATLVWGAGGISMTNAILNNPAGSIVNMQSDDTLSSSGTSAFNNSGTVNKTAGGAGSTTIAVPFNSEIGGLVNVNAGTLDFTGGGTCGGVCGGNWTVANGTTLGFAGGTFVNGGTLSGAGEVEVVNGITTVTFNGSYAITGITNINGGTATFPPASTITSVGATLRVQGGSVDFSSGEVIAPGVLNVSGGTLTGSDTVTVAGLFTWGGGSLQGTSNAVLNANGGMNISGAGQSILGRRVTNNAAAVMTGATMTIGSQPTSLGGFVNTATGTFDLQSAATFAGTGVVPQAFTNNGTFTKSAGGTATFGVEFHSTGTLNANSGTLAFNNVTNSFTAGLVRLGGGGISFQGGAGTMTINGGTLVGIGTITGNVNNVGGNVTPGLSPGILNIVGNFAQGAGGTLTVEFTGAGAVPGTDFDVLAITGSATLGGTLSAQPFAPALAPSGNFQIMTFASRVGDFGALINGTANPSLATTPGATNYVLNFGAPACGVNAIASANWQINTTWDTNTVPTSADNVCIGGAFAVTVSAAGQAANSLTVTSTAPFTISNGSLNLAAGSSIGNGGLTMTVGSTLTGTGNVDVAGPFAFAAGTISGSGTLNANGGMPGIASVNNVTISRPLNNAGVATYPGPAGVIDIVGGVFTNLPTGVFDISFGGNICGCAGFGSFINQGTMTKSGGAVLTMRNSFTNSGTVNVNVGTISFDGPVSGSTNSGAYNVAGTLDFGSSTHTMNAGTSITGAGTTIFQNVGFGPPTVNFNAGSSITTAVTMGDAVATFAAGSTANLASLTQTGGTLTGAAAVNVAGVFTWQSGTQSGTGTTTANGGINVIAGGGNPSVQRTVVNAGAGTLSRTVQDSAAGVFINALGATLDITAPNGGYGAGPGLFNNQGTLTKSSAGTFQIGDNFTNTGTVNINAGVLSVSATACTSSGPFNVAATTELRIAGFPCNMNAGTFVTGAGLVTVASDTTNFNSGSSLTTNLTQSGGTLSFNAGSIANLPSLTQSGGILTGTGTVDVAGLFAWSGGTQEGTGTTNANGGVNITGGVNLIGSRVLNSAAVSTWSAGNINAGQSSVWNNSGTLNITGDNLISNAFGGGTIFTNTGAGSVTKMTGVGTTTWQVAFNNGGITNANSGTLNLSNGGTSAGTFNVAAALGFGNGTHTLNGGVIGAGTVVFSGGTVNVNGPYDVTGASTFSGAAANFNAAATVANVGALTISGGTANLSSGEAINAVGAATQSAGTLDGSDLVNLSGLFTWSGGVQQGTGTTNAVGGVSITGGVVLIGSRVLSTAGVSTWSAGNINAGQSSVWNNTGTLNITGNDLISNASGGATIFTNSGGTVTKMTGVGTTTWQVAYNSTGPTNVNSGTLNLTNGGSSSGSFNVASRLGFGGGTHTLFGAVSGAGTVVFSSGTVNVNDTYDVTGASTFDGATANFNGPSTTVVNVGALSITGGTANFASGETITPIGAVTQSAGTLDGSDLVQLNGLFVWSGGIQQGTGTTNAAGGVNITGGVVLIGSRVLNTAGVSTWSAGNINAGQSSVWNNSGTLNITGNDLISNASGGGTIFTNTAAGTVTKSPGVGVTAWQVAFNNGGTFNVNSGTMNFAPSFTQTAGTTSLNGGNITGGITFNFNGGVLSAIGGSTITGNLNNAGATVRPGTSPGILNIVGNYIQGAGGILEIELAGLGGVPGVDFDRVAITGTATLNGTLNVLPFGGFSAGAGVSFPVMTFASGSGDFAVKNGLNIATPPLFAVRLATSYLLSNALDADMSVTKTDAPDPVTATQNVTYTITVSNAGPGPGTTAVLDDPLPASTTFVSLAAPAGWACTTPAVGAGGTVNCTNPSVAASANDVFTVVVATTVASVPSISNTATVSAAPVDPSAANNSATATTTVTPLTADLSVTKTDAPDPVTQGQDITYTITVTNNGPDAASNVALNDATPAGTTFVSLASPGGWTCSTPAVGGTGNVNCTNPTLANAASGVFTLVVNSAGAGALVTNTATIAATEVDPVPANNSATATTTVNVVADLAVTKTDTPDPIVLGTGDITYTVTVTNNGPNNAPTVTLTDTLPAGAAFVSATPSQGTCPPPVAGVLTCNLGTINNGANATVVILMTPTATGVLTNTAVVASGATDPNAADNTAVATTTVNAQADLAVTKVDTVDPVLAGTNITYQLSVTNNGPSPATNVVLTDNIPANVTFVSVGAPCAQAAGVVTCNFGALNPGSTTVVANLVVATTAASVPTVANTATVTATEPDPTPANNSVTQNTTVNPAVDLAVTKTDAPDPVNVGATLTYTVTVSNSGPSNATGVTLTDTLPANVTIGVATPSQGTCTPAAGVVTCNLGTINSGASATVTITVTPTAAAGGTTITNTASATATETDTNAANNTNITTTTAVVGIADVSITKTDAPDPVNAGANVTYTITVANAGPSSATAVTVTDVLPAGLTFVSSTPSVGTCAGTTTVTCNLGTLASGANATVTIVALVTGAAPALVSNTATVTTTTADPNAANNSATTTTTVTPIADIQVTVTDAPDPVTVNSNITYTVTLLNNGPSAAANVTATTALPANTTFFSATATAGTCVNAAGTITCNIGTMASGATVTATVIVTATASGTVNATVNVATTTTDPNAANNTATATTTVTTVVTATDFGLTVTPTSQFVIAGQGTSFAATATPSQAGAVFGAAVTFACIAQQHGGVACSVTPATVAAGASVANSTVNITTVAAAGGVPMRIPSTPTSWPVFWLVAFSLALAGVGFTGRKLAAQATVQRRWGYCFSMGLALLMLSMAMSQSACAGGPTAGEAPRGPVSVTVTATSGSVSRSTIVFVVVQ